MADTEQMMIQDQQREQQDAYRLLFLPPIEYKLTDRNRISGFHHWYMQTAEGKEIMQRSDNGTMEGMFPGYITEALVKHRLQELVDKSYGRYAQQKWSFIDKQPPQPESYFLFHRRFSGLRASTVRLPVPPMDKVQLLVFDQQEHSRIYAQGLPIIITAVGSRELHFHDTAILRKNKLENAWIISTAENYEYIFSAIEEFKELSTTEVWFRRAKNGMPQFIFCPADFARLPALALPLSQPGQPEAVLELSRLEAMPALLPERFRPEHRDDFYQWLLATDKFHIEDEDPENLELKPLLSQLRLTGFYIPDLKIPLVTRLYEEYVQGKWSMPQKQPAIPQSVYLFTRGVRCTEDFRILLLQELVQQANSLILSKAELYQLASSNVLPVLISIINDTQVDHVIQGKLEMYVGTNCRISFCDELCRDIARRLRKNVCLEVWFLRTQDKPYFIINVPPKRSSRVQNKRCQGKHMEVETGSVLS